METVNSAAIKQRAYELGADLCGIAPVERFADAPAGFHPTDIISTCKSVISVALHFPVSTLESPSPAAYTFVRNRLTEKMDAITFQLATELEKKGHCAVAVPSSEPYDYWDADRRHGQGILSLKHAAVRAGLGRMGKNTLLINNRYGNMVWLGALLVDQALEADDLAGYSVCGETCRLCLDSCPVAALDGTTIQQSKCRSIVGKSTDGGGWVYACNLCRRICPQCKSLAKGAE